MSTAAYALSKTQTEQIGTSRVPAVDITCAFFLRNGLPRSQVRSRLGRIALLALLPISAHLSSETPSLQGGRARPNPGMRK